MESYFSKKIWYIIGENEDCFSFDIETTRKVQQIATDMGYDYIHHIIAKRVAQHMYDDDEENAEKYVSVIYPDYLKYHLIFSPYGLNSESFYYQSRLIYLREDIINICKNFAISGDIDSYVNLHHKFMGKMNTSDLCDPYEDNESCVIPLHNFFLRPQSESFIQKNID